jgi:hypothetical protein
VGTQRRVGHEAALQPAIVELGVGRTVVGELPAEHLAVEAFAAGDVGDVEFDVVDAAFGFVGSFVGEVAP